jgi:hypothetical protein
MLKLPNCKGIEDIFSINDFTKIVSGDKAKNVTSPISDFLKNAGLSKPVLAYQFLLKVREGAVDFNKLDEATRNNIKLVVSEISSRLP